MHESGNGVEGIKEKVRLQPRPQSEKFKPNQLLLQVHRSQLHALHSPLGVHPSQQQNQGRVYYEIENTLALKEKRCVAKVGEVGARAAKSSKKIESHLLQPKQQSCCQHIACQVA